MLFSIYRYNPETDSTFNLTNIYHSDFVYLFFLGDSHFMDKLT